MASRIKMWSLERVIQNLLIHYQDGHWGLGLYSDEWGNNAGDFTEEFYYCFVPYPELDDTVFSLYKLLKSTNEIEYVLDTVMERLRHIDTFRQKATELGKQMNACLKGAGSSLIEGDGDYEIPDIRNPNCPLERK